jgi:hypothetical protein
METCTKARKVIEVLPAGTISGTRVIEGIKYRVRKHAVGSTKGLKKTSDYLEFNKALLNG